MARLTWGEGSVYEGDITISNGEKVPHGYGVYNDTKTGACYRGAFYYGQMHGEGELSQTPNPNDGINQLVLMKGTFKNSHFYKGVMIFEAGNGIEGEFDADRNVVGKAKYFFKDGSYFFEKIKKVGHSYRVDILQGVHVLYNALGTKKYEGYFNDQEQFDGVGTYYYPNGDYYHGIFKEGYFHDVGSFFLCLNQEKQLYIEFVSKYKKGALLKTDIVFDEDNYLIVGKAKRRSEACAKASEASIKKFLGLPKDTDTFTKNYALVKRIIDKQFANRPKVLKALTDLYAFHFMDHRFARRLKYIKGNLSYDFNDNKKIDLQWDAIFRFARSYKDAAFVEVVGSEKEATNIFKMIKRDPLYQQEFIAYTLPSGKVFDTNIAPEEKKTIAPSQKEKKPYQYPNQDLKLLKKRSSKGLKMKFVLSKWGYVIKGKGYCQDEDLIIPPYDDAARFDVKVIEKDAFYLNDFVSVQVPNFITIKEHAFYRCTNIKTIYLGAFAKVMPTAFECLFSLEQIVYNGSKEEWQLNQGHEEWIHYLDSDYLVVVHCTNGDLIIED